jgi:choloylglycine hydrolase
MEFGTPLNSQVIVIPRGYHYQGTTPDGNNGAMWKTKYGVVGMNAFDEPYINEGMNEKGLVAGHFMFREFAQYSPYTSDQHAKSLASWEFVTWVLTQFDSVDTLLQDIETIRVVSVFDTYMKAEQPLHFFVADATGHAVVIEPINGVLKVFENPLGIMTNAPSFDWQMTNVHAMIKSLNPESTIMWQGMSIPIRTEGNGLKGLPGDMSPPSRFLQLAFAQATITQPKTSSEAIVAAIRALNRFCISEGMSVKNGTVGVTQWEVFADMTNKLFCYRSYGNMTLRKVDCNKITFDGKKITKHDIEKDKTVIVDVTNMLH